MDLQFKIFQMGQLHRNYKIKIWVAKQWGRSYGGRSPFWGSWGPVHQSLPSPPPPMGEILQTCNKGAPGTMVEGPANFFFQNFFQKLDWLKMHLPAWSKVFLQTFFKIIGLNFWTLMMIKQYKNMWYSTNHSSHC